MPNSKGKFAYVLSYVQELKTSKKYNITEDGKYHSFIDSECVVSSL